MTEKKADEYDDDEGESKIDWKLNLIGFALAIALAVSAYALIIA
jgi:heme/copper-type cytochrome/quinol oxidase subunit 4